jgi:hypothetical protein
MSDDPESIRREAAILARRKSARTVSFTRDSPSDWRPRTVINPEDGQPFTDAAAWQLIADLLDRGEPLECIELKYPAGKKGYAMIPLVASRRVYVKFQLGAGKIIGRSFHYSEQP